MICLDEPKRSSEEENDCDQSEPVKVLVAISLVYQEENPHKCDDQESDGGLVYSILVLDHHVACDLLQRCKDRADNHQVAERAVLVKQVNSAA